jgi:hypothetical protein
MAEAAAEAVSRQPQTGTKLAQDLYEDLGYGVDLRPQYGYIGQGLPGVPRNFMAYAVMTSDRGALARPNVAPQYKILPSDSERARKRKAYSWMIDNQIAVEMPAVQPPADSTATATATTTTTATATAATANAQRQMAATWGVRTGRLGNAWAVGQPSHEAAGAGQCR